MKVLTSPKEVQDYLIERQWAHASDITEVLELSGGVSSQVWKVTTTDGSWVLKQALPKLKVKAEWFSDVKRIEREQAVMLALHPIMEAGQIPQIVLQDDVLHLYMMTCAPEGSVTWKEQLMNGQYRVQTAEAAGAMLGRMHEQSRQLNEGIQAEFRDKTYFTQLRIDPFHKVLAQKYPELAPAIQQLIRDLNDSDMCFVHGDFSPKNILVTPDEKLVLLDFEVGHFGHPVFDLAFCLGHLMLKGLAFHREKDAFQLIQAFVKAYGELPQHLIAHLGLMLLARVDGKSPVEYVKDEGTKTRIRQLARKWLLEVKVGENCLKNIQDALGVEG